jgi:hypothetical protein
MIEEETDEELLPYPFFRLRWGWLASRLGIDELQVFFPLYVLRQARNSIESVGYDGEIGEVGYGRVRDGKIEAMDGAEKVCNQVADRRGFGNGYTTDVDDGYVRKHVGRRICNLAIATQGKCFQSGRQPLPFVEAVTQQILKVPRVLLQGLGVYAIREALSALFLGDIEDEVAIRRDD